MKVRIKNIIYYLTLLLLSIIFIISLKNIINWLYDNHHTKKMIDKISDNTIIKTVDEDNNQEDNTENLIDVDFEKLKKINSDVVGYIIVNNTNINYPVVKTFDNEFYLNHSFDRSYNKAGWVFMDYRNHNEFFDTNTILYAHGRLDNTMFGSLRNVIEESWYKNQDNYIINYSNDYYNTMWQVFSVYKIKTTNDYLNINFSSPKKYQEFIDLIKNRSVYDFKVDVTSDDKLMTLSSCYDDINKVVLHAKLIKYQEKK